MKRTGNLTRIYCILLIVFSLSVLTHRCKAEFSPSDLSSDCEITSFSFLASNNTALSSDITGTINGAGIILDVPIGTDVTALIATYIFNGYNVIVLGTVQISSITPNNFADPVIYTVTAFDGSSQEYTVTLVRENMAEVPANTTGFEMGYIGVAEPVHTAASISAFTMGIHEVTYRLWYDVRIWAESNGYTFFESGSEGNDGIEGASPETNEPVTMVCWQDCIAWCNALSEKEGLAPCYYTDPTKTIIYRDATNINFEISCMNPTNANACVDWNANGYRLPTEAEWEYAARYIDGIIFLRGDVPSGWMDSDNDDILDNSEMDAVAWWNNNSGGETHDVGEKNANALGIYDMSGNVCEWCWDLDDIYTTSSPYTDADPKGPDKAKNIWRIIRGGCYNDVILWHCTSNRDAGMIDLVSSITWGFRLVRRP
jgi:sulfatase modifying factor 1